MLVRLVEAPRSASRYPEADAGRSREPIIAALLPLPRRLVPLALLVPGAVYLATLLPGVGHSGDSAELSLCAHVLGVPHPTGYPLYLLLAHAFDSLLPFGTPALHANAFSALCALGALALLWRLLDELRVPRGAALAGTYALAFGRAFWEHAIVAEVYALHALLYAASLLLFLRFGRSARRLHLLAACAVYALGFGNHVLLITLLPAIALLVWTTDSRAFRDPRALTGVLACIAAGVAQYAFLFWRGREGVALFRAAPIGSLRELVGFATGADFQGSMLAFGPGELLTLRLPLYAAAAWNEHGPLLLLAALGAWALGGTRQGGFLLAAYLGNLVFALGYDIPDLPPYFIPNHLLVAVWLAAGLGWLGARLRTGAPAAIGLVATLALAALQWPSVEHARGAEAASRALRILETVGERAVVVAGWHEFQYLAYLRIAEGQGGREVFPAHAVSVEEVVAYVKGERPLELVQLGRRLPPGLPVYNLKINHKLAYEAAGLALEAAPEGMYRLLPPRR